MVCHTEGFNPSNALELVRQYDVVVDASDNAPTRYLISDACVVAGRPLVSGAALGTEGQLSVYCHGDDGNLKGFALNPLLLSMTSIFCVHRLCTFPC